MKNKNKTLCNQFRSSGFLNTGEEVFVTPPVSSKRAKALYSAMIRWGFAKPDFYHDFAENRKFQLAIICGKDNPGVITALDFKGRDFSWLSK